MWQGIIIWKKNSKKRLSGQTFDTGGAPISINSHGSDLADVDGCLLCAEATLSGPKTIPARADARAAVPVQLLR